MFKTPEEAVQYYYEKQHSFDSMPDFIKQVWHSAIEVGRSDGAPEEKNKRWRLNERICGFLGIDKNRQLDEDLADEVIEKLKQRPYSVSEWEKIGKERGYWEFYKNKILNKESVCECCGILECFCF